MPSSADPDTFTGQFELMPSGCRFRELKTMFKRPDHFIFVRYYFIHLFEWVDIQIYPKPEHVEANNNNNKVTFFLSLTFYFTKKLILLRELRSSENNKEENTLDLNQCVLEKYEMLSWRSLRRLAHKSKAD